MRCESSLLLHRLLSNKAGILHSPVLDVFCFEDVGVAIVASPSVMEISVIGESTAGAASRIFRTGPGAELRMLLSSSDAGVSSWQPSFFVSLGSIISELFSMRFSQS